MEDGGDGIIALLSVEKDVAFDIQFTTGEEWWIAAEAVTVEEVVARYNECCRGIMSRDFINC